MVIIFLAPSPFGDVVVRLALINNVWQCCTVQYNDIPTLRPYAFEDVESFTHEIFHSSFEKQHYSGSCPWISTLFTLMSFKGLDLEQFKQITFFIHQFLNKKLKPRATCIKKWKKNKQTGQYCSSHNLPLKRIIFWEKIFIFKNT